MYSLCVIIIFICLKILNTFTAGLLMIIIRPSVCFVLIFTTVRFIERHTYKYIYDIVWAILDFGRSEERFYIDVFSPHCTSIGYGTGIIFRKPR